MNKDAGYQWRCIWIRFQLYALTFFFLACVRWITNSFGSPTIQQIFYHLYFMEDLIFESDNIFLITFVVECLIGPLALAGVIVLGEQAFVNFASKRKSASQKKRRLELLANFFRSTATGVPVYALVCSLLIFAWHFSVFSYVASRFGEDRFAQLYVDPASVQLEKSTLKNLVLIYVESLETSYGDPNIFGKDLLQDLHAFPGVTFQSYEPAPGTGWTIAAMVATQCGVPLQFVTRMDETGENVRSFLPGAICLPDILAHFGYRNVFLGGAALSFAGKGKFLTSHHYAETFGYAEWMRSHVPLHGNNPWGIYDDDLFALAKDKLTALHDSGRLFNLTLLTLDTHHPTGFYSRSCRKGGSERFEDIVECVSREVADFVTFAKDKGYLQDTNFVVIGDHLAMPNPVYARLRSNPQRRIFNKFISSTEVTKNTEEIIPFDLFPTILEYTGIRIDGQRLALGRSAFFGTAVGLKGPRMEASSQILDFSRKYEELWASDRGSSLGEPVRRHGDSDPRDEPATLEPLSHPFAVRKQAPPSDVVSHR